MTQPTTPEQIDPPRAGEPPPSPYDDPPPWSSAPPEAAAPVTAAPGARRTGSRRWLAALRERAVRLWAVLAVGAACLIVGLGVGVLVGHAGAGSDGRPQRPGFGSDHAPAWGPAGRDFGGRGGDGRSTQPGTSEGSSGRTGT
jgi:hypothetical protein